MAPAPGRPGPVEHEYQRRGMLAYLAAIDVHDLRWAVYWAFTRRDLNALLDRLGQRGRLTPAA